MILSFILMCYYLQQHMSRVTRKPVRKIKPGCIAIEDGKRLQLSNFGWKKWNCTIQIVKTKALIARFSPLSICSHLQKTGFLMTWLILHAHLGFGGNGVQGEGGGGQDKGFC